MKLIHEKKTVTTTHIRDYEVEPGLPRIRSTSISGRKKSISILGKGPLESTPMFVEPTFWSKLELGSPFSDEKVFGRDYRAKPTTIEEAGEMLKYAAYFDWSGHMLFDAYGRVVPYAQSFDYIGTAFSDRHLADIEAAMKYLDSHPWVMNRTGGPALAAGQAQLKIADVPYYNRDAAFRFLNPIIRPDPTSYAEMFADAVKACEKLAAAYPSVTLKNQISAHPAYNRDWLGIRPYLKKEKKP